MIFIEKRKDFVRYCASLGCRRLVRALIGMFLLTQNNLIKITSTFYRRLKTSRLPQATHHARSAHHYDEVGTSQPTAAVAFGNATAAVLILLYPQAL